MLALVMTVIFYLLHFQPQIRLRSSAGCTADVLFGNQFVVLCFFSRTNDYSEYAVFTVSASTIQYWSEEG
jgi:hypothetical protein